MILSAPEKDRNYLQPPYEIFIKIKVILISDTDLNKYETLF